MPKQEISGFLHDYKGVIAAWKAVLLNSLDMRNEAKCPGSEALLPAAIPNGKVIDLLAHILVHVTQDWRAWHPHRSQATKNCLEAWGVLYQDGVILSSLDQLDQASFEAAVSEDSDPRGTSREPVQACCLDWEKFE